MGSRTAVLLRNTMREWLSACHNSGEPLAACVTA